MNQLQAVALNEGVRSKKRLWREQGREQLESFRLARWPSRRRHDLRELLDRLNPTIADLSQAIEQEVENCPAAQCWRSHPGVGPLTALAFVRIIGRAERFQCGKQIAHPDVAKQLGDRATAADAQGRNPRGGSSRKVEYGQFYR